MKIVNLTMDDLILYYDPTNDQLLIMDGPHRLGSARSSMLDSCQSVSLACLKGEEQKEAL